MKGIERPGAVEVRITPHQALALILSLIGVLRRVQHIGDDAA